MVDVATQDGAVARQGGDETTGAREPRLLDGAREPHGLITAALAGVDLGKLASSVSAELRARGVTFGSGSDDDFRVDPVPRLITAAEWKPLRAGLVQRVRALNAFVGDIYGEQRIVSNGAIPLPAVSGAEHFEPQLVGMPRPPSAWIGVAGLDLVQDVDGVFKVLEDNVRTPSGLAYAVAARDVLSRHLAVPPGLHVRSLGAAFEMLGRALRAAAPDSGDEPAVVVLTDGRQNSAFYEHRRIASELGLALVTPAQLTARRGSLLARIDGRLRPVDVVYRRTDEDRLFDPRGRPTAIGELLLNPWRRGQIGCVNAFGTGVADDKLIHSYVETMVRFYLGEEPLLESVPTYDLTQPEVLAMVLGRIDELVIKPRSGYGGAGIIVCPHAKPRDVGRASAAIAAHPHLYVAQEMVMLSRHPTFCDGRLEPRHIDLRPYVTVAGDETEVVPGGLTRVSFERDALVVNSSQDGGAKDTWVLA